MYQQLTKKRQSKFARGCLYVSTCLLITSLVICGLCLLAYKSRLIKTMEINYVTSRTALIDVIMYDVNKNYECVGYYVRGHSWYRTLKTDKFEAVGGKCQVLLNDLDPNTHYLYNVRVNGRYSRPINSLTTFKAPTLTTLPIVFSHHLIGSGNITNYGSTHLWMKFVYGHDNISFPYTTQPILAAPNGTTTYKFTFPLNRSGITYEYNIMANEESNGHMYHGNKYTFVII